MERRTDGVTASNAAWEGGGVLRAFSSSSAPYFHARYFLIHFAEIRRNLDVGVQGRLFSTRSKLQERGCLVVEMRPALMMPLVKTYDNIKERLAGDRFQEITGFIAYFLLAHVRR